MPRIVMLNTVCSGSHGRIMRDIGNAAAARGMQVTIGYGRGRAVGVEPPLEAVRMDSRAEVLWHVAATRALDAHARASYLATRRFLKKLEAVQPDLVHLHNVHGYYLHAPSLFGFLRARGIPTVWTHHDCWALTGHCSHFVRANCLRWQTGCHDCPLKRAYPASYGLDVSRGNWRWKKKAFADMPNLHIIAPSRWIGQVIAQSYLADTPRTVVPSGVDLALFRPGESSGAYDRVRARHGIAPGEAMLLGVALPFDERKGYADTLALAKRVQGHAHVVLIGLTAEQIRALPQGVTGLPPTDGAEALIPYYEAADCLINTTYEDTYPTVNMEAMACGTPVAGYGAGGAAEQLIPPMAARVPVGDVEALAREALALAAQKDALRGACRAYAEGNFDRNRAVETYLAIYQKMLGA